MAEGTCTIDGCGRVEQLRRKMCSKHYQRWKKTDSTDGPVRLTDKQRQQRRRETYRRYDAKHRAKRNAARKALREANLEAERERCRAWHVKNPGKNAENTRAWRLANLERVAEKNKAWYAANKEWSAAKSARRRAQIRETEVEPIDFSKVLAEHGMVCHICTGAIASRDDLHFDHVIPLARGGPHMRNNIKPAHAICNQRKGDKLMSELTFIKL